MKGDASSSGCASHHYPTIAPHASRRERGALRGYLPVHSR